MNINYSEKTYIGEVEALEVSFQRGLNKLPRKGKEILTVYPKPLPTEILGKDENGFYLQTIE